MLARFPALPRLLTTAAAAMLLLPTTGLAQGIKPEDFEREARRAAPRDAFPVLDHPEMVSVEKGSETIDDDEMIIGVDLGGEQKAYPVSVMGRHELANDTCGGQAIATSW